MKKLAQAATVSATLLFGAAAQAAGYRQIYAFAGAADAQAPTTALVQIGTRFIGVTCAGGANQAGAIYTVTPGGTEQVIYSFGGLGDGACPSSGLLHVADKLYGVTLRGGAFGLGTVFMMKLTMSTISAPAIIHSFTNSGSDGKFPAGGLVSFGGAIYGTTLYGGTSTNCNYGGCGTVFFITPHNLVGTLYSFQGGSDGALPATTLLPVGNLLFGTTNAGGNGSPCGQEGAIISGCGTVFSITPRGDEKIVYAFQGGTADGSVPNSNLVKDGVLLYGTTQNGGSGGAPSYCPSGNSILGCGTVFAVTTGGAEHVVHNFGNRDGARPEAGLTLLNDVLYGTTSSTNQTGNGDAPTLFSIAPAGKLSILYKFAATGGPFAPLTGSGEFLWGTTANGGNAVCPNGCGTIFGFVP